MPPEAELVRTSLLRIERNNHCPKVPHERQCLLVSHRNVLVALSVGRELDSGHAVQQCARGVRLADVDQVLLRE